MGQMTTKYAKDAKKEIELLFKDESYILDCFEVEPIVKHLPLDVLRAPRYIEAITVRR